MWRDHFEKLYNSVHDDGYKNLFYRRLAGCQADDNYFQLCVQDVMDCVCKQKLGKAAGLDGIHNYGSY